MLRKSITDPFALRIIQLINTLGIKQKELAWLLGISPVTVSRWISGEIVPSNPTGMIIKSIEMVIENGNGELLSRAIKQKTISGGTPEALRDISELALGRRSA